MTDTTAGNAGNRSDYPVIDRITDELVDGFAILRFGVRFGFFGEPIFVCFVDETPKDEVPSYALYVVDHGASARYECYYSGRVNSNGRWVFLVLSPIASELLVGGSDDLRCGIDSSEIKAWIHDLSTELVTISFDDRSMRIGEPEVSVTLSYLDGLSHALHDFVRTEGSLDGYEALMTLLSPATSHAGTAGHKSTAVPLWLLGWIRQLLACCREPRRGKHLALRAMKARVGEPLRIIANRLAGMSLMVDWDPERKARLRRECR